VLFHVVKCHGEYGHCRHPLSREQTEFLTDVLDNKFVMQRLKSVMLLENITRRANNNLLLTHNVQYCNDIIIMLGNQNIDAFISTRADQKSK